MMIYGYEWSQDTGYCYCVDIDGDSIYIGTDNGVLVFCDGAFRWLNNDEAGISDASSPQNPQSATFDLKAVASRANQSMVCISRKERR